MQCFHTASAGRRPSQNDPLLSFVIFPRVPALQRLLPVMPVSQISGFREIAVIPNVIAAYPQRPFSD